MQRFDRRELLKRIGCGTFGAAACGGSVRAARTRPRKLNFVFILIDDMGWKDLSCYGSRFYETPNIDRLATQGMRFTNAYTAAPLCSPTRASIMTGKYPARLGMTSITQYKPDRKARWLCPESASELALDEVTMAEALKPAGYRSACIGKWHLGDEGFYPENQGFDVNKGGSGIGMPTDYFYPEWKENRRGLHSLWGGVPLGGQPGEYLTDRLTDEALNFIQAEKENPFFLYLSHYAVHIPLGAKGDKVDKYKAKIRPDDPQNNAVYAAMIESVDESVGRVMRKIEEAGIAGNTVVFFYSDNGGLHTPSGDGKRPAATSVLPLRSGKVSLYEGGIRVPLIVRWPGGVKPGSVCHVPVISNDFFPTMAELAGVPKAYNSPDGQSLTPVLRNKGNFKRDTLYWHYPHPCTDSSEGYSAIRQGNCKLLEFLGDGHLELYDLATDMGEKNDLAARMPQKAAQLKQMLQRWRQSVNAKMPVRNPDYKPVSGGSSDGE